VPAALRTHGTLDRMTAVPDALAAALSRDPARPLVTHVGPDGARTELSVRTLENGLAKAANLLRDDADLQPGGVVAVALPVHWQASVWLGACALVGGVAWFGGDTGSSEAEVAVVGPDGLDLPQAPLTLASSLHPFGMPFAAPLPPGVLDAAVEVRAHGDRFTPYHRVSADDAWLRAGGAEWTQGQALDAGRALAERIGAGAGSRVLLAPGAAVEDAALALLALPLAVDGAVVLLTDPAADAGRVAEQERCDAVLG
jgi:uncharacterized protein (TIGR03089 family)